MVRFWQKSSSKPPAVPVVRSDRKTWCRSGVFFPSAPLRMAKASSHEIDWNSPVELRSCGVRSRLG